MDLLCEDGFAKIFHNIPKYLKISKGKIPDISFPDIEFEDVNLRSEVRLDRMENWKIADSFPSRPMVSAKTTSQDCMLKLFEKIFESGVKEEEDGYYTFKAHFTKAYKSIQNLIARSGSSN